MSALRGEMLVFFWGLGKSGLFLCPSVHQSPWRIENSGYPSGEKKIHQVNSEESSSFFAGIDRRKNMLPQPSSGGTEFLLGPHGLPDPHDLKTFRDDASPSVGHKKALSSTHSLFVA